MFKYPSLFRTSRLAVLGLALAALPAMAADFPAGTFSMDGKLTVTFDGNGQFRVTQGEKLEVAGSYVVKGDQIRVTDREGPGACSKSGEQTGTYHWRYDSAVLTFSKVKDACMDRVGSLDAVKWTQQH